MDYLLPFFPEHEGYIEVFGGAANLLLNKEPSPTEIYNDLDEGVYTFFKVLRSEDKFERFMDKLSKTPYSKRLYEDSLNWYDEENDVKKSMEMVLCYMFFIQQNWCWVFSSE